MSISTHTCICYEEAPASTNAFWIFSSVAESKQHTRAPRFSSARYTYEVSTFPLCSPRTLAGSVCMMDEHFLGRAMFLWPKYQILSLRMWNNINNTCYDNDTFINLEIAFASKILFKISSNPWKHTNVAHLWAANVTEEERSHRVTWSCSSVSQVEPRAVGY